MLTCFYKNEDTLTMTQTTGELKLLMDSVYCCKKLLRVLIPCSFQRRVQKKLSEFSLIVKNVSVTKNSNNYFRTFVLKIIKKPCS